MLELATIIIRALIIPAVIKINAGQHLCRVPKTTFSYTKPTICGWSWTLCWKWEDRE